MKSALLSLFSAVFGDSFESGGSPVSAAQFFLPGMVAGGVMLTSFQAVGTAIAEVGEGDQRSPSPVRVGAIAAGPAFGMVAEGNQGGE